MNMPLSVTAAPSEFQFSNYEYQTSLEPQSPSSLVDQTVHSDLQQDLHISETNDIYNYLNRFESRQKIDESSFPGNNDASCYFPRHTPRSDLLANCSQNYSQMRSFNETKSLDGNLEHIQQRILKEAFGSSLQTPEETPLETPLTTPPLYDYAHITKEISVEMARHSKMTCNEAKGNHNNIDNNICNDRANNSKNKSIRAKSIKNKNNIRNENNHDETANESNNDGNHNNNDVHHNNHNNTNNTHYANDNENMQYMEFNQGKNSEFFMISNHEDNKSGVGSPTTNISSLLTYSPNFAANSSEFYPHAIGANNSVNENYCSISSQEDGGDEISELSKEHQDLMNSIDPLESVFQDTDIRPRKITSSNFTMHRECDSEYDDLKIMRNSNDITSSRTIIYHDNEIAAKNSANKDIATTELFAATQAMNQVSFCNDVMDSTVCSVMGDSYSPPRRNSIGGATTSTAYQLLNLDRNRSVSYSEAKTKDSNTSAARVIIGSMKVQKNPNHGGNQKGDTITLRQPSFAEGHEEVGSFGLINFRKRGAWSRAKSASKECSKGKMRLQRPSV